MADPYEEIREHFEKVKGVVVNTGKGAQGMKVGKKMFAMFYKGQLLLKLSPERVAEVIKMGDGFPHDPGTGKPMKDRVLLPDAKKDLWIQYCEESREYEQSIQ